MSMGYQVGVTPLQMVAAISSVANGGDLIQPRVVRALVRDGKRVEVKPTDPRPDDLERHRRHAHRHHGADRRAWNGDLTRKIAGYTIAGKTGTASKLVNGRYSHTDYYASFVGFLPSRNPVATIIVVIDSPHARGYYGGPIAGPVFQRIAEATLRHLGVPPTLNAPPPVLVARRTEQPEIQTATQPARCLDCSGGRERRRARSAGSPRTQRARSAACPDEDWIDRAPHGERCVTSQVPAPERRSSRAWPVS